MPHTFYKYSHHLWMHMYFWQKYKTVVDLASVRGASSAYSPLLVYSLCKGLVVCLHAPVDSLTSVAYFRKGGCIYQSGALKGQRQYNKWFDDIYSNKNEQFNDKKNQNNQNHHVILRLVFLSFLREKKDYSKYLYFHK